MAELLIARPQAAQHLQIPVTPDASSILLNFSAGDATLSKSGNDLVFSFEDGSSVSLTGFYQTYSSEAMPEFRVDGENISGEQFFAALGDETLMPAAGPAAAAAQRLPSGGRFSEFGTDGLLDGIDKLDGLDVAFDGNTAPETTLNAAPAADNDTTLLADGGASVPDTPVGPTPDAPAEIFNLAIMLNMGQNMDSTIDGVNKFDLAIESVMITVQQALEQHGGTLNLGITPYAGRAYLPGSNSNIWLGDSHGEWLNFTKDNLDELRGALENLAEIRENSDAGKAQLAAWLADHPVQVNENVWFDGGKSAQDWSAHNKYFWNNDLQAAFDATQAWIENGVNGDTQNSQAVLIGGYKANMCHGITSSELFKKIAITPPEDITAWSDDCFDYKLDGDKLYYKKVNSTRDFVEAEQKGAEYLVPLSEISIYDGKCFTLNGNDYQVVLHEMSAYLYKKSKVDGFYKKELTVKDDGEVYNKVQIIDYPSGTTGQFNNSGCLPDIWQLSDDALASLKQYAGFSVIALLDPLHDGEFADYLNSLANLDASELKTLENLLDFNGIFGTAFSKAASDEGNILTLPASGALDGQAGDDALFGSKENDTLIGGAGSDTLAGGQGDDLLTGDGNLDNLAGFTSSMTDEQLTNWADALETTTDGNDYLSGGAGADTLLGLGGDDALYGGTGNDFLYGGSGNDTLAGGGGNDVLYGGAGDDFLDGGAGADTLAGGNGNDIFVFGQGDKIDGGNGIDFLLCSDSTEGMDTLLENVQNVEVTIKGDVSGITSLGDLQEKGINLYDTPDSEGKLDGNADKMTLDKNEWTRDKDDDNVFVSNDGNTQISLADSMTEAVGDAEVYTFILSTTAG